jgi:hypothetical protein
MIFKIGDSVAVKEGMEHMPEHKGMIFTIAEIAGNSIALKQPDGSIHKWYVGDELTPTPIQNIQHNMSLPLYEIVMSKGAKLDRVAMVKRPAVENTSMFFSEDVDSMKFATDVEKRLLYAPAMIPNKMIFRKDVNGSPANTFYTPETIEQLNETYFKKAGNQETNIEHTDEVLDGVFVVESWIVHDNKNDKATALGFDVPNGTLMMCHKIENDEVWNKVKAGDISGLSVEMFAKYELRDNTNLITMNTEEKKGFISEIVSAIKMAFEPKKEEEEKTADEIIATNAEAARVDEPAVVPVVVEDEPADTELADLKAENEDLKNKLQEATDKIAQYEIDANKGKEESMLFKSEIEQLKSKIAFGTEVEIPKVPTAPKKKPEEMTALERARANY